MEISKLDLPSRGQLYPNTPDTLTFKVDIEVLKHISASATTGKTSHMIDAIHTASNIVDPLTVGDYYFCSTLLLSLSKEIPWDWKCTSDRVKFSTPNLDFAYDYKDCGFDVTQVEDELHVLTPSIALCRIHLNGLKSTGMFGNEAGITGKYVSCDTENHFVLNKEILCANTIPLILPTDAKFAEYGVPMAEHIDEFHAMGENARLKRMRNALTCLSPESFGLSLADRLDALTKHRDALAIFNVATEYSRLTTHGIKKLLEVKCPSCGSVNTRGISFSPEQFF